MKKSFFKSPSPFNMKKQNISLLWLNMQESLGSLCPWTPACTLKGLCCFWSFVLQSVPKAVVTWCACFPSIAQCAYAASRFPFPTNLTLLKGSDEKHFKNKRRAVFFTKHTGSLFLVCERQSWSTDRCQ